MKNYKILVPTYKRKNPKILNMLSLDKDLELYFCIRHEELQFYDDFCKDKRIHFVDLGENIVDLGDTRKRMMQYAIDNDIKYVVMLDDTLDNVYDVDDKSKTITQCIEECVNRLETDELKQYCIMYQFHRPERKRCISDKEHKKYFVCCPVQAYIINTKLYARYGLKFKSYKESGSEDEAFFVDTLQKGLVTCSNVKINVSGDLPAVKKEGGTHDRAYMLENLEKVADERENTLMNYIGRMYGVYVTKKHRSTIGCLFAMASFDYDYFYNVLVKNRELNQKVIDCGFKY